MKTKKLPRFSVLAAVVVFTLLNFSVAFAQTYKPSSGSAPSAASSSATPSSVAASVKTTVTYTEEDLRKMSVEVRKFI